MKQSKKKVFYSLIVMLLSVSMLIGTTFAWFTDSVTSKKNIIQSGNVDLEMYWTNDLESGVWYDVEDEDYNTVFAYDNWEPGYTQVKYIKLKNAGSLALNYKLAITHESGVGKLAEVINVHYATDGLKVQDRNDLQGLGTLGLLSDVMNGGKTISGTILASDQHSALGDPSGEVIITIAMSMITTAGNDYQNRSAGEFSITAVATQAPFETDSFGADYDSNAKLPVILVPGQASADVTAVNGMVAAGGVSVTGEGISAFLPENVKLESGAESVTLKVTPLKKTTSNIVAVNDQILIPVDVHIDGVAQDNNVPIIIDLGEILPRYLNMGNYTFIHVENSINNAMTLVDDRSELTQHNTFTYDPATGQVSVAMASFSEVLGVADTDNEWKGTIDNNFSGGDGTQADPYLIANGDQLAYFNEVISNDNASFGDKYYKLLSDIDLGGRTDFYPIGYHAKGGNIMPLGLDDAPEFTYIEGETEPAASYVADNFNEDGVWYTYGGSFRGTFDGNGNVIKDFYQNTWALKGNYSGNYWNEAMGLFGYVNGGTVKNLTVESFRSDGEFTPTGVIAAYAANATFENIAINGCNPCVYNTGNGGIVGIGGNTSDTENQKITFKNITIDKTNTITALWGSWDVACGGLIGMFRGGGHVYMENCNVSAKIDVYNDVCGNYQYYWYRYSGILIGTNKNMTTDSNGYTVPETDKFHATNCTVHFGDWNDYYYCELVANTLASYTHDHQFSRLEVIESLTEITDDNGLTWKKTGNFLIFNGEQKLQSGEGTCYHIMQNADGTLYRHLHDVADNTNKDVYETVNGQQVLKENNQRIFLPFNQLFTGYGWGVKHIPLGEFEGVTILPREGDSVEKFESKFTGNFLYRVGNGNAITVGTLFGAKADNINTSGVWVTVEKLSDEMDLTAKFTKNATDWTQGTVKFEGTGVAKITIQDYDYCKPTTVYVEVVDAINATSATSATKNNVVLLNNCGFSSLEISNGYTLYGNGFTLTCSQDSPTLDMGYAFVTLDSGILDNVQIVCPNFDYAVLYKSNLTSSENRSLTTDNKTRYYNAQSGVMVKGNSQILNSRISGARAAVNIVSGDVVIDNSRIELGAVASILVGSANSLTLRDVTLVQKPATSAYDANKKLMGFSVLYLCDSEGKATNTILEGTLVQDAWVDSDDKQYVPSAGQGIVDSVMAQKEFVHSIDGKDTLNLGFAYLPEEATKSVAAPDNITDNRTDKATVPYELKDVNIKLAILSTTVYVYSYKNTNGTSEKFVNVGDYVPTKYSDIITVDYSDTADGLTTGKSFGSSGWVYELNVDLDKLSGYQLDFSKLSMSVNGVRVTDFKVNGNAKPASPVAVTAGGTNYNLTATVNGKEYVISYKVTGTETSKESPSLVASNYEAGLCVASSYGGTWHGAAPALQGIQIKYWSVAEQQYKTINLSDYTPATPGKLDGTNTTWTYSPDNGDFTLTLTGGQVHSGNSVYAMPVVCEGKLYFVAASSKGLVNSGNSARTIPVSYSFKDNNNGDVLNFSHTWSVAENKDDQYNYSDFCNGTKTKLEASSSGGTCVAPDTLITLADGSQKRVDSLKGDEMLLVWNLETGKYESAPIVFVDNDAETEYDVIHLYFSNGSDVKVISEHGFFDLDLGKYVYIDAENYADYVGHRFVAEGNIGDNDWNIITLDRVVIEKEITTAWSPVTFEHLCYYTNGVLSMPGGIEGLFNIFEVDTDTMSYDKVQMQKDIENYGLFTIEDFGGMIPEIAFEAFNGDYLKVAIGKGLLTWEDIADMAERYIPLM